MLLESTISVRDDLNHYPGVDRAILRRFALTHHSPRPLQAAMNTQTTLLKRKGPSVFLSPAGHVAICVVICAARQHIPVHSSYIQTQPNTVLDSDRAVFSLQLNLDDVPYIRRLSLYRFFVGPATLYFSERGGTGRRARFRFLWPMAVEVRVLSLAISHRKLPVAQPPPAEHFNISHTRGRVCYIVRHKY